MVSHENWMEHFAVSPSELAQFKRAPSQGQSLLQWCLLNNKLSQADYLVWAVNTYLLPVVTRAYFEIAPDQVFWARVKEIFPWTASFFPLTEWDGTLLIACLEPPKDCHLKQNHRFVLAGARELALYWDHLNGNESQKKNRPDATLAAATTVKAKTDVVTALTPKAGTEPAPTTATDGVVTLPPPAPKSSLWLSPTQVSPKVDQESTAIPESTEFEARVSEDSEVQDLVAEEPEQEFEKPDGMFTDLTAADIEIDFSVLTGESASAETSEPTPAAAASVPTPAATAAPTPELTPAVASAAPPALNMESALRPVPPDSGLVFENSDAETFEGQTQSMVMIPLESCQSYAELGDQALNRVEKVFDHGMILLFKGGQLKPWKWTHLLLSIHGDNPPPIDLSTPSIFWIVFRTSSPYNGHVVINPINKKFFDEFHRGQVPTHVTIVPILMNKQIGGMVMGIANKPVDTGSLEFMQKLSEEVSTQLARLRKSSAA